MAGSCVDVRFADGGLILPVFGDPRDGEAVAPLSSLRPDRKVVPIFAREILLGSGELHGHHPAAPREEAVRGVDSGRRRIGKGRTGPERPTGTEPSGAVRGCIAAPPRRSADFPPQGRARWLPWNPCILRAILIFGMSSG